MLVQPDANAKFARAKWWPEVFHPSPIASLWHCVNSFDVIINFHFIIVSETLHSWGGYFDPFFFQSLLEEIYGEPVMGTPTPAQFLKNSSRFTNEQDLNKHTRMRAFEAVVPRTKKVENFQVIALSNAGGKFANPLQSRSIPSWSNLQEWSAKLRQSPGRCIQVQEGGEIVLHNISTLKTAQLLHEIRECKDAVERELTFFSSPKNTPRSIQKKIDVETMTSFRELVHYSLSTEPIKEYDMLPGDLARLCIISSKSPLNTTSF